MVTYCVVPMTRHSGKGKATETVKDQGCLGGGGGGVKGGGAQGTLRAVKLHCVILQRWTKPRGCTITGVTPHVNCGPWVTMTCLDRFTTYNKCTIWPGGLTVGGGEDGKSVPSAQYCCEPKNTPL